MDKNTIINILENEPKQVVPLREFVESKVDLPIRVYNPFLAKGIHFLTTSKCNFCCEYCYNYYSDKQAVMMDSKCAIKLIEEYLDYQQGMYADDLVRLAVFTGGEPTLNPDLIFDVVGYIKRKGLRFLPLILTNGVIPIHIVDELIKLRFAFQISFDGGNSPLRKAIDGEEIYPRIVRTIDHIRANSNLPIILRSTITQETIGEMINTILFAKDHGVDSLAFDCMFVCGKGDLNKNRRSTKVDYVNNFIASYKLAKTHDIRLAFHEMIRYKNQGNFIEYPKLIVLPDGGLAMTSSYLASDIPGAKNVLVGRCDSVSGIVVYPAVLKKLTTNFQQNLDLHCAKCKHFNYCHGRNKNLHRFMESFPAEKDQYSCDVTRMFYDAIIKTDLN